MASFGLPRPFAKPEGPRQPRRAAYVLPSLFTSGNIFLGFLAIMRALQGALFAHSGNYGANGDFAVAAKAIGVAVVLDGLDGRIARMTHTTSDFGRELDSLADVITFGIAPAVLAFAWGVQFALTGGFLPDHRAGYFICFLFLVCGAARLARFNITTHPVPTQSGPSRSQILRRPAHPRGGCAGFGHRLRIRCRTHSAVGAVGALAGAARSARFSDGQHVALPELQGDQPAAPAIAADRGFARQRHLFDLELRAAVPSRRGNQLRGQRRHYPRGWNYSPHPPPQAASYYASLGAAGWINEALQLSGVRLSWGAKCAMRFASRAWMCAWS